MEGDTGPFYIIILFCILSTSTGTNGQPQCPIAGCHPNRCFCINQFSDIKENPSIKQIQSPLKLSSRGCLANGDNIICPLDQQESVKEKAGCLVLETAGERSKWWKCLDIENSIALPIIDISGNVIASDGFTLASYRSNGSVVPKPVKLYPNTGQIVDMIFTNNSLFEMIYKCGLIVAYSPDGVAWASIWINNTDTTNGTFVPLATPAVSGERMYLLTGFWATNASINAENSFILRLYAVDSTTFVVKRLRIGWYHEMKLEGTLPAIEMNYKSCVFRPPSADDHLHTSEPDDDNVAQVMAIGNTVIVMLNYKTQANEMAHVTFSLSDHTTSYIENCVTTLSKSVVTSLASFQPDDSSEFTSDYIVKASRTISKDSSTLLERYDKKDICKSPIDTYNLSMTLFKGQHQVQLTTDLLTAESSKSKLLYVIFGVIVYPNEDGYVIALQVNSNGHGDNDVQDEVIWKFLTPSKSPPVGQIAVLEKSVVFSTGKNILIIKNNN